MHLPTRNRLSTLPGFARLTPRSPFIAYIGDDDGGSGGGGGGDAQGGSDSGGDDGGSDSTPKTKEFTDRQIDSMLGRAGDKAAKAALDKLAEETGYTVDELKAIAATRREEEEARKSEAEKARDRAAAEAAASTQTATQAQTELMQLRARTALKDAGMDDTAARVVSADALGITPASSEQEISDAVARLKDEAPGMFAPSDNDPKPTRPAGGGSNRTKTPTAPKSTDDKVAEIAGPIAKRLGMKVASDNS